MLVGLIPARLNVARLRVFSEISSPPSQKALTLVPFRELRTDSPLAEQHLLAGDTTCVYCGEVCLNSATPGREGAVHHEECAVVDARVVLAVGNPLHLEGDVEPLRKA